MNVRYGPMPTAPPAIEYYAPLQAEENPAPLHGYQCLICYSPTPINRTFPCGCVHAIHERCIPTFRAIGGICPRCKQVWIPVVLDDRSETTIIARRESKTHCICSPHDTWRTRVYYSLCCVLLLGGVVLCCFLLIKVYG
jgi:hypothetical protein